MVSSAARGVLQTIAASALLGEAITGARTIGISITLVGSACYSVAKAREGGASAGNLQNNNKSPSAIEYTKIVETDSSSTTRIKSATSQ
jgi:hypothetical protein